MNIKISIVIFILLSFFNIGAISNEVTNGKNSFSVLETNITNISEFQENGVKLQYKTRDNIEKESNRIKEYLTNDINDSYKEINKNQFEIFNNDFYTNIKMWCEDKYTYVEITLINKNSQYTTAKLKRIIQKLENRKSENAQYFFYYEGRQKEIDNNYSLDRLANENNIQKTNLLNINNGFTGTGYLSNGDKINFALIKYNTGAHIIISTPIIFTTY
ncbi:MAG: hypothetical protein LLF98_09860 [Clostridium sp.]|uniref:hypothetical protein n=1 Tax=Clostridium sp. TaxID=1506 RepID=UPI0025B8D25A|nr:hypothetical protein [Clostridium sp.]MCE5221542.1 hypothetical protein [Clostridium sp.]